MNNRFLPNYAVAPGELLLEELEHRGMTQAQLAERTGLTKKTINEMVKGKAPITADTALKFERILGQPAQYWLNLETLYQEDKARIAELERLKPDTPWLSNLPVKKMIEYGWIRDFPDRRAQLWEVLSFYGIATVKQWDSIWQSPTAAYRRSQVFDGTAEALSAWLRRGEIEAKQLSCAVYDAAAFKKSLDTLRLLTQETDPEIFVTALQKECASCGVAVVLVPELPKTHVSGATRWLSANKALIQLSLRHKSNDHLWFTFFHEAGHIVLHGKKEVFVDSATGGEGEKEDQANRFAAEHLIPSMQFKGFVKTCNGRFSKDAIRDFSSRIGIAPGIVVGRLQHEKLLPPTHCNDLKVRYQWTV